MTMDDIKLLERTTDQMIDLLAKIKAENNALKNKLEELTHEKSQLMQKNDQARTRLESMISRLKTLEQTA
jgi:cell division protein ZapB